VIKAPVSGADSLQFVGKILGLVIPNHRAPHAQLTAATVRCSSATEPPSVIINVMTGATRGSGSLGPYRGLRECIPTRGDPLLIARRGCFPSKAGSNGLSRCGTAARQQVPRPV
jgi:hypothetical protein